MPRRCAVIGCAAKGSTANKSFYRFPSDETLCKKWLRALCNLQLLRKYETEGKHYLNKNKFICSDHFEAKHLRNVKAPSQGLFEGAIPSLNINLNMNALVSSIQQSEILHEPWQPKKTVETKSAKPLAPTAASSHTNAPGAPVAPAQSRGKLKRKGSGDDVAFNKKNERTSRNITKSLKQIKDDILKESSKRCLPKIEQVFIPHSTSKGTDSPKHQKTIREKKIIRKNKKRKLCDPLENKNIGLKNGSAAKANQKRKVANNKTATISKGKPFKVTLAPKNTNQELTLPSEGPKRIIKVVVPQKKSQDSESEVIQSRIIKFVVPKRCDNGEEISLAKSQIYQILQVLTKHVDASASASASAPTNTSHNTESAAASGPAPPHTDHTAKFQLTTLNLANNTNLRAIFPPKHIANKVTNLVGSSTEKRVSTPELVTSKSNNINQNNRENGDQVICMRVEESKEPSHTVALALAVAGDVGDESDSTRACVSPTNREQSAQGIKEGDNNNPSTELSKHIRHVIEKRLGDTNTLWSDDDSMDMPLMNIAKPENNIKQMVKAYLSENKHCSCKSIYRDKMTVLQQEEKDLKRKLKNLQKYVFHYKNNIRKRRLLVAELRKQIPLNKTQKTSGIIKTIVPLEKLGDHNPRVYRFCKTLKTFALDLFYSSPLSYSILEQTYLLPSRRTLKCWLSSPQNTSLHLLSNKYTGTNLEATEEMEFLDESTGALIRSQAPKQAGGREMNSDCMGELDGDLEELSVNNCYDITFSKDLTEAIMNA